MQSDGTARGPLLLVIAGPSGSGKSTLCNRLVGDNRGFSRVVTATTRSPRPGEIDGTHYHFLSSAEFDRRLAAGEFLEWARVHGDRRYGTLAAGVLGPLAEGRNLVMSLDVQGVESLRRLAKTNPLLRRALTPVFIVVDPATLRERMRGRGQDGEAEMSRRLATAEAELREAPRFEYRIQGGTREEDYAALLAILHEARGMEAKT